MTTKKIAAPKSKTKAPAKPAVKSAPKPVAKLVTQPVTKKHKVKVVRDSFTMPGNEYQKIDEIKAICLKVKMHVKKSEVLRAGLQLLAELNATELKRVLGGLEKIKTGRPKKH